MSTPWLTERQGNEPTFRVPTDMLLLKPIQKYPGRSMVPLTCPTKFHFHYAFEFFTQLLAHMLDSLVRVPRRVGRNHFVSIPKLHVNPYPIKQPWSNTTACCDTRQDHLEDTYPALQRNFRKYLYGMKKVSIKGNPRYEQYNPHQVPPFNHFASFPIDADRP